MSMFWIAVRFSGRRKESQHLKMINEGVTTMKSRSACVDFYGNSHGETRSNVSIRATFSAPAISATLLESFNDEPRGRHEKFTATSGISENRILHGGGSEGHEYVDHQKCFGSRTSATRLRSAAYQWIPSRSASANNEDEIQRPMNSSTWKK